MVTVHFHKRSEISDNLLIYNVIAARYCGKWMFCRHKQRGTWEMPGGHRDAGESIYDSAKRELWEETGALEGELREVCVYSVTKDEMTSYGMIYYGEISVLEPLPAGSEMAETALFDTLPASLTYPEIAPRIFEQVQGWLNRQSNIAELWDIYDECRNLTGRLHQRGAELAAGEYHLVVEAWIRNRSGQYLLTKRGPGKGFPNLWETTGGSALAGENSMQAVLREVQEEMGLQLDPDRGELLFTLMREDSFKDVWLFRQDFELKDVILQSGETVGKMYADRREILKLYQEGAFVPLPHLHRIFETTD